MAYADSKTQNLSLQVQICLPRKKKNGYLYIFTNYCHILEYVKSNSEKKRKKKKLDVSGATKTNKPSPFMIHLICKRFLMHRYRRVSACRPLRRSGCSEERNAVKAGMMMMMMMMNRNHVQLCIIGY